jgi:pimeloyl-ACP methyl ester carboxylesterase
MVAAVEALAKRHHATTVTLIGYSGGGTLAMLIAGQAKHVHTVVTLAANLDVASWARYHHYSALRGSLDPAQLPPLRASVRQIHLLGAKDRNVPPALAEPVISRQPNAKWEVISGADHACCWTKIWPAVLRQLPTP